MAPHTYVLGPRRHVLAALSKRCYADPGKSHQCGKGKFGGEPRNKRWTWQQTEHGQTMNGSAVACRARERTLNEYWQIFVDDTPSPRMPSTRMRMYSRTHVCHDNDGQKFAARAKKKNEWDPYLQLVCGSTPNAYCAMDRKQRSTS